MTDYAATIQSPQPLHATASSIRDGIEKWWSVRVDRKEDGFTIHFNNSHVTFAYEPGHRDDEFVWACTDANMIIENVKDRAEWRGTRLIWTLKDSVSGSEVTLHHEGLNSEIECFDVCVRGWQHYFEGSLKAFLNGETPTPETN